MTITGQATFLRPEIEGTLLRATQEGALEYCALAELKSHAIDLA